jgi:hypothetical protein
MTSAPSRRFQQFAQSQRHVEHEVFLLQAVWADRAGVVAAVPASITIVPIFSPKPDRLRSPSEVGAATCTGCASAVEFFAAFRLVVFLPDASTVSVVCGDFASAAVAGFVGAVPIPSTVGVCRLSSGRLAFVADGTGSGLVGRALSVSSSGGALELCRSGWSGGLGRGFCSWLLFACRRDSSV